jgi:hypothetical protein
MRNQPMLSINSSAIPVAGIGGVGMLVLAAIIAIEFPLTRTVSVLGGAGGLVAGVCLILFRRNQSATKQNSRQQP